MPDWSDFHKCRSEETQSHLSLSKNESTEINQLNPVWGEIVRMQEIKFKEARQTSMTARYVAFSNKKWKIKKQIDFFGAYVEL